MYFYINFLLLCLYRLHDTLKKRPFYILLKKFNFHAFVWWKTVSKALRKSANHVYKCSFLLSVFTCQLSILQQISGPMFHIFVETPTSVWVSLLGTCIFLPIRYVSSLSFIWYKKFSFAILYRYSPIVWNYLLLKSHN